MRPPFMITLTSCRGGHQAGGYSRRWGQNRVYGAVLAQMHRCQAGGAYLPGVGCRAPRELEGEQLPQDYSEGVDVCNKQGWQVQGQ